MSPSATRKFLARAAFLLLVLWALDALLSLPHRDAGIAGTIGLSALVASLVGFAFAALAGSAFAYLHLDPVHAVHTLVVCSIATQLYAVWKLRAAILWRPLLPMVAAGALTVPLGVWILRHADSAAYALGLGAFLCAYGSYAATRRAQRALPGNRAVDAIAGALGGLTGGLAGLPGPSVTIWLSLRGLDKLQQRAAYQPFILVMQVVTFACLHVQGTGPAPSLEDVRFVPFALVGGIAGYALFQRMTHRQFHAVTSVLLVASGVGLLARAS
ncbi:MAG: sulfite exporter TauE/SafE family protein [Burkholderiales bacterium]